VPEHMRSWGEVCGGRAWSDRHALADIQALDVDAVRVHDGFEYRYHRGGFITWFALSSGEELPVKVVESLPQEGWVPLEPQL